jgi:hypothetical protein
VVAAAYRASNAATRPAGAQCRRAIAFAWRPFRPNSAAAAGPDGPRDYNRTCGDQVGPIRVQLHGLQPWSRYEQVKGDESLTVESLPAVHAYGVLGKMLPPVMGSLLVHRVAGTVRRRVYLSGDTLTGDHLDVFETPVRGQTLPLGK